MLCNGKNGIMMKKQKQLIYQNRSKTQKNSIDYYY